MHESPVLPFGLWGRQINSAHLNNGVYHRSYQGQVLLQAQPAALPGLDPERSFTSEFKHESACLVLDQGYKMSEASRAVGVGESTLRRWVDQLKVERQGITPVSNKALTPEQQRIQELETQLKRIEREKEILKKATALLMSDSMSSLP